MWFLRYLGIGLIVLLTSCSKHKTDGTNTSSKKADDKPAAILSDFDSWPQKYWTAKAKVFVTFKGNSIPVNLSLRAIQGKKIWFSANAMGLMEIARGVVNEDSILVWDKFNNQCYVSGMEGLGAYLPIPIGIQHLQHFLMGRVFWDSLAAGKQRVAGDTSFVEGSQGDASFTARILQKYNLLNASAHLASNGSSVVLRNDQFKLSSSFQIAFHKEVVSRQNENGKTNESKIRFEFSKFEFVANPPDCSFELPGDCPRQLIK